jgi:hypothetical protein
LELKWRIEFSEKHLNKHTKEVKKELLINNINVKYHLTILSREIHN